MSAMFRLETVSKAGLSAFGELVTSLQSIVDPYATSALVEKSAPNLEALFAHIPSREVVTVNSAHVSVCEFVTPHGRVCTDDNGPMRCRGGVVAGDGGSDADGVDGAIEPNDDVQLIAVTSEAGTVSDRAGHGRDVSRATPPPPRAVQPVDLCADSDGGSDIADASGTPGEAIGAGLRVASRRARLLAKLAKRRSRANAGGEWSGRDPYNGGRRSGNDMGGPQICIRRGHYCTCSGREH